MTRPGQRREESNLADLILELAFFLPFMDDSNRGDRDNKDATLIN